jgi:hypothetical protein
MLNILMKILDEFSICFSHKATYTWFSIIIVGFIVRHDHVGVSSFMRWLFLESNHYESILHFFRGSQWSLNTLIMYWIAFVVNHYPKPEINGRILLVGDGIKVSKEAQKMPGVKKLHQNSDNSGKAETIRGHHFGYVGMIVGTFQKIFCIPLRGELHEGTSEIRIEDIPDNLKPSIVTRMGCLVLSAAMCSGKACYVALDRYFSTGPMFLLLKSKTNEKGEQIVHIITQAKKNYVGFFYCKYSTRKYNDADKVRLVEMFDFPEYFKTVELIFSNKKFIIEYAVFDLLWKPLGDYVRFVCVRSGNDHYILMSSDLNLPAIDIIRIYLYRSKIEVMFLFLKHAIGGFCYRFWTKSLEKLGKKKEADLSNPDESAIQKIAETVEAIERFVNLAGISLGLLMYFSLTYPSEIWNNYNGWMRTRSSDIPSEGVVQDVIRMEFFSTIRKVPLTGTLAILHSRMRDIFKKRRLLS